MKNLKTPTKRYVNKRKIAPNKPIKTANVLMENAPIPAEDAAILIRKQYGASLAVLAD